MLNNERIIIVDDQRSIVVVLGDFLETLGYEVIQCVRPEEALRLVKKFQPFLMITDLTMPRITGLDLMEQVKAYSDEMLFIVMTGHATVETAVEAMRLGAEDYVQKPISLAHLKLLVGRVEEKANLRRENAMLRQQINESAQLEHVVGSSESLRRVSELVLRAAPTLGNVLIVGESGTGKEMIAHSLHGYSRRSHAEFVAVDCVSLPPSLFESELFGYEKGAFTGAHALRHGLLEKADGGTLFLDEITELAPELQSKLLRVLQERRFRRIGGSDYIDVNLRVVAATRREPQEALKSGHFLEGLYYRLNVIDVRLPPLRERSEDIPVLIRKFQQDSEIGRELKFSPDALSVMRSYPWPGNIRELKNIVERLLVTCVGDVVDTSDLPEEFSLVHILNTGEVAWDEGVSLPDLKSVLVTRLEKNYLKNALRRSGGSVSEAAKESGVSRKTFHQLMKKYGIKRI